MHTEENIVDKTAAARENLERMRDLTTQCFAILCKLCSWNPNEADANQFSSPDASEDDCTEPHSAAHADPQPDDPSSKALVVVAPQPELEYIGDGVVSESVSYEEMKNSCKMYARKIAQLTHPDKIMRFSAKAKAEMLAIFHQSKIDLEEMNRYGLIYGYIRVRAIRGELDRVPPELIELVENEYRWVVRQINHILGLPYMSAVSAYCEGNHHRAVMLFKRFIENTRSGLV